MVLSALAIALQQFLVTRRSYVTVSGKGFHHKRLELGAWRAPAYGLVVAYALLAVALPVLALLVDSLLAAGLLFLSGNSFRLLHHFFPFAAYPGGPRFPFD